LLMNVPRPGFCNLASTRREYESKILFHKRNKKVVAARTQIGGGSARPAETWTIKIAHQLDGAALITLARGCVG
jgi:hypothetical protein